MCIRDRLKTVVNNAPIVMREPENYDARAEIMWAGCLAHNTLSVSYTHLDVYKRQARSGP